MIFYFKIIYMNNLEIKNLEIEIALISTPSKQKISQKRLPQYLQCFSAHFHSNELKKSLLDY